MIEIREVKTKREQKEFLEFANILYKDNPNYVPPLYSSEADMFKKNYVYYDTSDSIFFNAYEDGKMVGRIQGILQKASNEKNNEKRIRFTRFDSINKQEVADKLFEALENWGLSKGMDTVCGPLGFSDLEREGLLIEGFDQLSTFEEQYNADYYGKLIENIGYVKDVDWVESKIYAPDDASELHKMADFILKRYNLKMGSAKSTNEFLRKYKDGIFEVLDESYDKLYGTVPFTDGMKKMLIDNFNLIIELKYVQVILDENDRVISFGLCFPGIGEAFIGSGGHLTPKSIIKFLKVKSHPKVIDLALVGVRPEYANRGISTIFSAGIADMLSDKSIDHAETNLNLEDNHAIQNNWKRFNSVQHKRRRSYVKKIGG